MVMNAEVRLSFVYQVLCMCVCVCVCVCISGLKRLNFLENSP